MLRPLLLALTLLLTAPLAAQAATPFAGRWADDFATCRNTRAKGGEIPVMITRWSIETAQTFCRVLAAARTTDRTWRLRAHCGDDGTEPRRRVTVTLRLERERLALQKESGVRLLVRCSP
jgi:hypothetical protein